MPEFGPSGGGNESADGSFKYSDKGLVTYIFSAFWFPKLIKILGIKESLEKMKKIIRLSK